MSGQPHLDELRTSFGRPSLHNKLAFHALLREHTKSKRQSLLDLSVAAANLTLNAHQLSVNSDPLVLEAFRRANPQLSIDQISDLTEEQFHGILNNTKGKYFEVLVADRLNSGEQVGDVILPPGFRATLADDLTQAGWDLEILDAGGMPSDYLQLKATESVSYIRDTLERYPDIAILTTEEVATHDYERDNLVLDSGLSEEDLEAVVSRVLDTDTTLEVFLDAFNPLMPLILLASQQGYKVVISKQTMAQFEDEFVQRSTDTVVAAGLGALGFTVGGLGVGLPAVFATRYLMKRYKKIVARRSGFRKQTEQIRMLNSYVFHL